MRVAYHERVPSITDRWQEAEAALPPSWELQGLRCASTGLQPAQRSELWVAEACGPAGGCARIENASPDQALSELAQRLRALTKR